MLRRGNLQSVGARPRWWRPRT